MNYEDQLNRVLKYGLSDRSVWGPIVGDFLHQLDHNKDFSAHQSHPLILADRLQDDGDPRGEILRGLGQDSQGLFHDLHSKRYIQVAAHSMDGDFGGLDMSVYRHLDNGDRKLTMGLEFPVSNNNGRGIHRYKEVTPEEAYSVIRHLPDEHRVKAEEFLRQRFGFHPTE